MSAMPPLPGGWSLPAAPGLPSPAAAPVVRRPAATPPANATLVRRVDQTAQVATFDIAPDDPARTYLAGQYASLGLEIDGAFVVRPYSMASLPGGQTWEFHVRRVREGTFSPRLFALQEGARLHLGPAKGRFTLAEGDRRPHLFMATGTGIAPFVAMLRADLAAGSPRPVTLIHGAAHADELGYTASLRALAGAGVPIRYLPTISRPGDPRNAGWTGLTGRAEEVLARAFDRLGFEPGNVVAYLCGNPGMVDASVTTLLARGVPDADVRREAYWLDKADTAPR